MLSSWISWIMALALGGIALCVTWLVLSALIEGIRVLWRRRSWWRVRLDPYFAAVTTAAPVAGQAGRAPWSSYLVAAAGFGLGLWAWRYGRLMGLYLLFAGPMIGWYLTQRRTFGAQSRLSDQVEDLVERFYSQTLVVRSTFTALDQIAPQLEEPLKGLITSAVDAFHLGRPADEILQELTRKGRNHYLSQFVAILERAARAERELVLEALQELEERLRQRRRLQAKAQTALALLSGEARFLQAANATLVIMAIFVPFLRDFYTASLSRQMVFMALSLMAALTAAYFDQQIHVLKERVL